MARPVRSGLIMANMETTETGVVFLGPLEFDEEIVCVTGRWEARVDPSDEVAIADALTDVYSDEFPAWCARKDAARATQASQTDYSRPRISSIQPHTPCPVLWAGR